MGLLEHYCRAGVCSSNALYLRSSLFWNVTQHRLVFTDVSGQPIGPIFKGQAIRTAWLLNMGPTGCPETSVTNYQSTLSNIPEERRSHLHSHASLKSRMLYILWEVPRLDPGQDIAILRFFVDILSPSRQIPGQHLKYATITSFQILSYHHTRAYHLPYLVCNIDSILI